MELDLLDRRVLAQLDKNCRASNSEIARKLRVNKSVVGYRIKNLEKQGIITGYYAIIDTFKLGYFAYRLYLKLQYASPQRQQEITDYLVSQPCVWWAGLVQGNFNLAVLLWAKNQSEIAQFWSAFSLKFRDNIADSRVSIYHGLEHYCLPFAKELLGGNPAPDVIGIGEQLRIDNADAKLLKLIASNAAMPLLQLANELGVTPAAVRYRLRQLLKKKIIVAFRVNIALDKLGYTIYKTDLNLKDFTQQAKLLQYARGHPNVFYIDRSIGWADCEIEICALTPIEFYSTLEEIRFRFSSQIKDFGFFAYSKILKTLYVPADLKGN